MAFDYNAMASGLQGLLNSKSGEQKSPKFNVSTSNTGFGKIGMAGEDDEEDEKGNGPLPTNQRTFKSAFKPREKKSRFAGTAEVVSEGLTA